MVRRPSHEQMLREKYKQDARERKESIVIWLFLFSQVMNFLGSVLVAIEVFESTTEWKLLLSIVSGVITFVVIGLALVYLFRWIEKKWILDVR